VSEVDNRKHRSLAADLGLRVSAAVAWVSGILSVGVFIFLMVNHIQIEAYAPLNDPELKALKAAIQKDPRNAALREQAQLAQYRVRRYFFMNQDLMRTAGMVLFGALVVFLAAIKTRQELALRLPVPVGVAPREGGPAERAANRWAVAAGAGLMVVVTMVYVYISPPEMEIRMPDAPPAAAEAPKPPGPVPAPGADAPRAAEAKPVPADAWPAFRGPLSDGVAHHAKAPVKWDGKSGEGVLWKADLPREGAGSVVTWEGKVFVPGGDEKGRDLYCYSAADGKLLWTGTAEKPAPAGLKIQDGTTWAPSTPATDGERVYAIYVTGEIVAWDFSGKRAWSRDLGVPKVPYGHASSLVVHGGRVIVQMDEKANGRLIALDARTGEENWKAQRAVDESWATPTLMKTESGAQIVAVSNPLVTGHDPATGRQLWSVKCMGGEVAPSAAVAGPLLFVASDHALGAAFKPGKDAAVLWKHEEDLPDVSSPVSDGKRVLMCSAGGMMTCFAAADGKVLWTKEFDTGFYGSPILCGERAYVMDQQGVTIVLKLGDTYEELARNPLGEKADATPAIPEGRIYVRSSRRLYCIGEAKK
jgi:outer membrane protein assembly factor BamB